MLHLLGALLRTELKRGSTSLLDLQQVTNQYHTRSHTWTILERWKVLGRL